jgi:hypothetical protein
MLVVMKLRYRISRASNMTPQQLKRFAVERLNDGNVATMYRHDLEAELPGASEPEPVSFVEKWKRMKEAAHENKREKSSSTRSAKR